LSNSRGSAVIEMVLIMPLILILFFITIWGGQLMFTWTGINYSASNAAMDAAKTGEVTDDICTAALENIKQWVPGAKDLGTDISTIQVALHGSLTRLYSGHQMLALYPGKVK